MLPLSNTKYRIISNFRLRYYFHISISKLKKTYSYILVLSKCITLLLNNEFEVDRLLPLILWQLEVDIIVPIKFVPYKETKYEMNELRRNIGE